MVDGDLKGFTKRAKDILLTVSNAHRIKTMDFLNRNEQSALEPMAEKSEYVSIIFDGGFESAERRRAVIFPNFMSVESMNTNVSIFKIEVIGAGEITHSQIMGSLMGLNIDRSVIGDIIVDDNGAFFASCSEFDQFLKENFTKVGRYNIRLELMKEKIARNQQYEDVEIIVSSMRLDVVVKALIQSSRSKAEEYLDAGFIRLNHVVDKKPSRSCQIGDILSIRKHGRFEIIKIKNTTKSGKFVLIVSKSV